MNRVMAGAAVAATLAVAGAVGSSMIIAPGAHALGQELSWKTPNQAKELVIQRVQEHTVIIDNVSFPLEELGYTISVEDLSRYKAYNISRWNEEVPVSIDGAPEDVEEKLKNLVALPEPVDATLTYQDGWVVTPGAQGQEIDAEHLLKAVNTSIAQGKDSTSLKRTTVEPDVTTRYAEDAKEQIERGSTDAAITLDGEQILEISPEEYAGMLNITVDENGLFEWSANDEAVDEFIQQVPALVNSAPDNGEAVVGENGEVLKVLDEWKDGREITQEQMRQLREDVSASLVMHKNTVAVNATPVKAEVNKLFRRAVVDVDARTATFYENDEKVYSFPVAVGKPGWQTDRGNFKVHTQLSTQDMGCGSDLYDYCVKGVPWISYYNNDEAFHGAFWHNDFGNPNSSAVSHGCVNMSVADAEKVYRFLQVGSPVEVR